MHWQTGTRAIPWNLELQPQVFVEMSHELAEMKKIKTGERVLVESSRGKLECTLRIKSETGTELSVNKALVSQLAAAMQKNANLLASVANGRSPSPS